MKEITKDGFGPDKIKIERSVGMRYHLQLTDVDINIPGGNVDEENIKKIMEEFDRRYSELYGEHAGFKEAGRDLINEFVRVIGETTKVKLEKEDLGPPDPSSARKGERQAFFPSTGEFVSTTIYDGDALRPGNIVMGPAILEMTGTTVVVPPDFIARLDEYCNVYLEASVSRKV